LADKGITFAKDGETGESSMKVADTSKALNPSSELLKNNSNLTPAQQAEQQRVEDLKTGAQSPNYDSHEPGVVGEFGPEQPGVVSKTPDSYFNSQASQFDGKGVFAQRGTGACSDFGMTVGGRCPDVESYKNNFKLATSRFCSLTGKKVVITSGNRTGPCNKLVGGASGSSHMSGLAMDTAFSNLNNQEKVVAYLYFVAQGFNNLGGYGSNKAVHMDMRASVNRWGPNYSISSCQSGLYPDYARTAFSLMGVSPCDRDSSAPARAKAALQKMSKSEFAIPATQAGQ
jgi:hypothetical protein